MMNNKHILLLLAATMTVGACRHTDAPQEQPQNGTEIVLTGDIDTTAAEDQPVSKPSSEPNYFEQKAQQSGETSSRAKSDAITVAGETTTKATKNGKSTPETIYVETDGAQGRVWGHVTMKGDRGTGTIHDWDENTLTVSVTRHGNELFAVDQNSRQYVFKLKNKKTQE